MDKYEIVKELLVKRDIENWYKADITDKNGDTRMILITDLDENNIRGIVINPELISGKKDRISIAVDDIHTINIPYLKLSNEQFKSNEI